MTTKTNYHSQIAQERLEVNMLMEKLIENNDVQEKRQTIIDKLNQKYPEILKNRRTAK